MKTAVPKHIYLNPLFVIDICKLNTKKNVDFKKICLE